MLELNTAVAEKHDLFGLIIEEKRRVQELRITISQQDERYEVAADIYAKLAAAFNRLERKSNELIAHIQQLEWHCH